MQYLNYYKLYRIISSKKIKSEDNVGHTICFCKSVVQPVSMSDTILALLVTSTVQTTLITTKKL